MIHGKAGLIIIILFLSSLFAQEINLSGTVKIQSTSQPVSGAVIILSNQGLRDTTDEQGTFQITNGVTDVHNAKPRISSDYFMVKQGNLHIQLSVLNTVSLKLYSLNGKLLYKHQIKAKPGKHIITVPSLGNGVHFYELRIGNKTYRNKWINLTASGTSNHTFIREMNSHAHSKHNSFLALDSLLTWLPEYKVSTFSVDNYKTDNIEIFLKPKDPIDTNFQFPDPDSTPPVTTKPVKVYIMSGQSNMVGFGQVSTGGKRWGGSLVSVDSGGTVPGIEISVYDGSYSPDVDYDALTASIVDTMTKIGGNQEPFPTLPGDYTHVVRTYFSPPTSGDYWLQPGYGGSTNNIAELDGKEIYRKNPGENRVRTAVTLDKNKRYHLRIVYFNKGDNLLWYVILDIPGTLFTLTNSENKFPHLVDDEGNWTTRNDVWYTGVISDKADTWLTVHDNSIGPELQFGHVMGHHHDEVVLLLKASIGNRSLAWDCLPPGSERYNYDGRTYAGYGDSVGSWPENEAYEDQKKVKWYAGKQYDVYTKAIHDVLDNLKDHFKKYQGQGYEIAGFVWWQGHKDQNRAHASRYEFNMVNLINTWRTEFNAPNAKFVLATIGFGGWNLSGAGLQVANAQLAMNDWMKYPEFIGNVKCVESRDYWRDASISPKNSGHHYNLNAETYYLVGNALGWGMVDLLKN